MGYLFIAGPFLLVIVVTVFAILLGILGLHARTRYESFVFPTLIGLLVLNLAVQPILIGRDLRTLFFGVDFLQSGFQSAEFAYFGKALIYLTLLVAMIEVVHQIVARVGRKKNGSHVVFAAFLFYFFTAYILPGFFGEVRAIAHFYFYLPLIFAAVYFSAANDPRRVVICFRNAIGLVLVATIAVALVKPEMVVQQHFRSAIPLFDFRIWGLAAHPNAFAPLALSFLILLKTEPFGSRFVTVAAWGLGVSAVILAQSKTVWVVALFLLAVHHFFRLHSEIRRGNASVFSAIIIGGSYVGAIVSCLVMLAWSSGLTNFDMSWLRGVDTKALSTLSGRDIIWEYSLREWRENPLFGYGLDLWGDEYRRAMALPTAYHAHNQFIQTIAASGLVGLLGLILYIVVLVFKVVKIRGGEGSLALSLVLMLLIRCFSEPPFELRSIADANVIMHLCLFAVVVSSFRRTSTGVEK